MSNLASTTIQRQIVKKKNFETIPLPKVGIKTFFLTNLVLFPNNRQQYSKSSLFEKFFRMILEQVGMQA